MLPDIDGFRICQKIREEHFYPVIMLTAKVADADKIMGLTIGADDYILKPFNPLEVIARVKTQSLRRYKRYNQAEQSKQTEEREQEYDIRGLLINKETHKCTLYGKEVPLTPLEFEILWYLCEHRGEGNKGVEMAGGLRVSGHAVVRLAGGGRHSVGLGGRWLVAVGYQIE